MRILFVAMADSVHTARWIDQLRGEGWDIHLFPAYECWPHESLRDVTVHRLLREKESHVHPSVRQTGPKWLLNRGSSRISSKLENINLFNRPARLARSIRRLKPDVIHVMEMQRSGYLFLDSTKLLADFPFPPVIYSCWGNDIFHFGARPEHQDRIKAFLAICDYLFADARRDLALAREYSFKGEDLGVYPVAGGYDIDHMERFRRPAIAPRRLIMLKGYHGGEWGGRALVALEAMRLCASALKDYEVVIFSAGGDVCRAAENLQAETGIKIRIVPRSPHDTIISLMGEARISIGVSVSDGTPNAMLEAMVMGAFPIQSDTVSTSEWIRDGINGLLVAPEDPEGIAAAVERAALDDELVEAAAKINQQLTRERIDYSVVQPEVVLAYEKVKANGRLRMN